VQGWEGDKLLAESGDTPSRWLWSGFSTKARKRRELEPAKSFGFSQDRLADKQAQKGNVPIRPRSSEVRGIHSIRGTRRTVPSLRQAQDRPKVTQTCPDPVEGMG
jgi:hypothetical protein